MKRIVAIVHRIKNPVEGQARPTLVAVKEGEKIKTFELATEQDELDFVLGILPTGMRKVKEGEYPDVNLYPERHIERDKVNGNPKRVPAGYDGLRPGDTLVMALGGSGDRMAYAAHRQLKDLGGRVMRIAPFLLKEKRKGEKEEDHLLLLNLFREGETLFQEMTDRDLDLIRVREAYFARTEAMKARIGCEQRLRQRFIGRVFLTENMYPEGRLEDEYDSLKANDKILQALLQEERRREAELKQAVRRLTVWEEIFEPLEGVGEMIAARLVVAIGDIRRFKTDAQLKKFCGVHVLPDGKFVRRRSGEVANWHPEARQALYLLGDQFNRRPESVWGKKLREYKRRFREKYPEPVETPGAGGRKVKKYTDGHIHKMATWRTITKFVEWLHHEWSRLEVPEGKKVEVAG